MDAPAPSLIEELDARQNEVLEKLDALNAQVEALLAECLTTRDEPAAAAEGHAGVLAPTVS